MKQSIKCKFERLNNDRGVALVVAIMVFVVMAILGTSAVAIAYSDNIFSIHQEDTKKAQYAARSAVVVVEQAIIKQIEILKGLEDDVDAAIQAYENAPAEQRDAKKVLMDAAKLTYENFLSNDINNRVLPTSGTPTLKHDVVLSEDLETDGNTDTFTVGITYLSSEKFKLSGEAFVGGKKGKATKILNIKKEEITKEALLAVGLFEDALWAFQDIAVDANQEFKNKVYGKVSYGKGPKPKLTVIGTVPLPEQPRDPNPTIDTADVAFGKVVTVSALGLRQPADLYDVVKKDKSYDIGDLSTGKYTSDIVWDGKYTYNVDTSNGDVILMFNKVTITSNNVTFNASGGGSLYIYVENLSSTASNNNVEFNGTIQNANTQKTDIFLYIKTMPTDVAKNNFSGRNLYIYAPTVAINVKNNAENTGAIIAHNISMKNNGTYNYLSPKNNFPTGAGNYSTEAVFTLQSLAVDSGNSHWTKN